MWERLKKHFGYQSPTLSVKDFAITLFKSCYALSLEEESALHQDALVFLKRWRDNVHYQQAFRKLSNDYAEILGIEKDLQNREIKTLLELDLFRLVDQRILSDLAAQIFSQTISAGECEKQVWNRRSTHWFNDFDHVYEALRHAAQFLHEIHHADLRMDSLSEGILKYQNVWFRLDQTYRKFIFHVRAARQPLLDQLTERIENLYSNNFLLPLNDGFQAFLDPAQSWSAAPLMLQSEFFERHIRGYLGKKNKIAVIISDALRYEIGEELAKTLQEEDKITAQMEAMLASLPSYTQLGMAALLPHTQITIAKDGTAQVDGLSATGAENRAKILKNAVKDGAAAIRSADLLNMGREESRELAKANQVVYVYHDQIDAIGDDKKTEDRVFEAAHATIGEIVEILKKLTNANFTNLIITADHGFIYQSQVLDESEFVVEDAQGEEIYVRNRRFVMGRGMKPNASMKLFTANQLGLTGEFEVMIPKSINRLRQQGSGSRYVHGGASLQEVVIPLIKVNKKRKEDVSLVNIEVIASSSAITTGQISIALYQTEPVSGKVQPRQLKVGIYTKDDVLLSDEHVLNFDLASENPREREVKKPFILSRKADEVNHQTIYLKLKELEAGTSHFKLYKEFPYQLRRSFTSDFDL